MLCRAHPAFSALALLCFCLPASVGAGSLAFRVEIAPGLAAESLDGRLLVLIAKDEKPEPRFQVRSHFASAQVYGVNVAGWQPGSPWTVADGPAYGFPIERLADLPAGEYFVQALLHRYVTVTPAHGHTIQVPWDRGEGQQWNRAPGNLFSKPVKLRVDPAKSPVLSLTLDGEIPPIEGPKDTKYVRHVRIQSNLLTAFWGRPVYLGAHVLVPWGFDEHVEARYPLMIFHGHFPADFGGFREEPPDPNLEPDWSERFQIKGYNRIQQQEAHDFYRQWTSPDFPRFLVIEIQHANPLYDDSYAVNSANLGPYGDAITHELIPAIERQFRGIGAGWARFLYGGSTGGWEALAAQVFYPDEYNGAFAACPDPIDFHAYTQVNLYEHENAFYDQGPFALIQRPSHRNYLGEIQSYVEWDNRMELALGTKSRSGGQWDIWQAVYSPVGEDGYPKPIFDKRTGVIDRQVAAYWREHFDLVHILKRDWSKIGAKLVGKIHLYCGDMDNYYLNNAVYLAEAFLDSTENPHYAGEVDYGDRAEHCWNGDHENPNYLSRLRYNTMYLPKILKRIEQSAPEGADLTSWRY
ncbi:MAG TPA: alpha/beta hydrolase-fold protein [Thermoanaerobaculia bacterium]|nr:alpha/beta hydrolase-fold protein [Thermoanaerobaculia bacterium]